MPVTQGSTAYMDHVHEQIDANYKSEDSLPEICVIILTVHVLQQSKNLQMKAS